METSKNHFWRAAIYPTDLHGSQKALSILGGTFFSEVDLLIGSHHLSLFRQLCAVLCGWLLRGKYGTASVARPPARRVHGRLPREDIERHGRKDPMTGPHGKH